MHFWSDSNALGGKSGGHVSVPDVDQHVSPVDVSMFSMAEQRELSGMGQPNIETQPTEPREQQPVLHLELGRRAPGSE